MSNTKLEILQDLIDLRIEVMNHYQFNQAIRTQRVKELERIEAESEEAGKKLLDQLEQLSNKVREL